MFNERKETAQDLLVRNLEYKFHAYTEQKSINPEGCMCWLEVDLQRLRRLKCYIEGNTWDK